jgi:hypothetical protein
MSRFQGYRRRWKGLLLSHANREIANPLEYIKRCNDSGETITNKTILSLIHNLKASIPEMLKVTGGSNS